MNGTRMHVVLRWLTRAAAVLVIAMVLLVYVGEGGFNPFQLTWNEAVLMTAFWVAIAGLAVAWWSEWLGGSLAVGGMLVYYFGHRWIAGTWPAGWAFRLIALTGALVLLVACLGPSRTKNANAWKGSPS